MRAMLGLVEARERDAGDAGEDAVLHLEHRHLLAELVSTAAASSPI